MESTKLVCLLLYGLAFFTWAAANEAPGGTARQQADSLKVPPSRETADKLLRHFIHRDHRDKRQAPGQAGGGTNNVIFVIDSSNSIRAADFRVGLVALKTLINKAVPQSRYAFVNFATEAELVSGFVAPDQALEILDTIPRLAGSTNTQAALLMCLHKLYGNESSGFDREGHKNVVLVTDGLSNRENHLTQLRAFELKNNGTELFVVAVGGFHYGIQEIVSMASSSDDHVYRVNSYQGLLEVVTLLPPYQRPAVPMYKLP